MANNNKTNGKKTDSKKKTTKQKNKKEDISTKRTIAFIAGLFVLALSVFLIVAFASFIANGGSEEKNACGSLGITASQTLFNGTFGIATFFIPVYLIMVGLNLVGSYNFKLLKSFILFSLLMIWTSFFAAVVTPEINSSVLYGGEHGRHLQTLITKQLGEAGVYLTLIITAILWAIYFYSRTQEFITKMLRLDKIKKIRNIAEKLREKVAQENGKELLQNEDGVENREFNDPQIVTLEYDADGNLINDENANTEEQPGNENTLVFENLNDKQEDDTPKEDKQTNAIKDGGDNKMELIIEDVKQTEKGEGFHRGDVNTPYDPKLELSLYKYPPISLLKHDNSSNPQIDRNEQNENIERIRRVLRSFGVEISTIKATVGPTITLYEITPAEGVRITKIRNLEDDIALSLAAEGIRIIAPMPGKGTIGIEVPNKKKCIVSMESIINSKTFQESKMELPCALGKTITNEVYMIDLAKAPHMLVAGATGMGKSVGLNVIVTSLLYKKHPTELKIVMVDPKKVEFSIYAPIANQFLAKLEDEDDAIITENERVVKTLNALCKLMDDRYQLLKKADVRNIVEYNELFKARKLNPENGHDFMPYYVVVIDEYGDLIMTAGKEVELPICRIAQLARAVGIHMIIATQRPTTNIITGTIKANFPARVAFRVTSSIDSKIILDRTGANQLIGRGDMLYLQNAEPVRVQCAFVDTPEVKNICKFISEQQQFIHMAYLPEPPMEDGASAGKDVDMNNIDSMFAEVAKMIVGKQLGSTSLIQRQFSIGYNRAGRLMDQMERAGIVGPQQGSKPREVLIQDYATLDSILISLGIN